MALLLQYNKPINKYLVLIKFIKISKCVVIKSYHSFVRCYTPKKVCNITKKNSHTIISRTVFTAFRKVGVFALLQQNNKAISPQQFALQLKALQNKRIFLTFCEIFQKTPIDQLSNDNSIISAIIDTVHKEPSVMSRAFQLGLEVVHGGRIYSAANLQKLFENDFTCEDIYKTNDGFCTQADIYTGLCLQILSKETLYNAKNITLVHTPIKLTKEKLLQDLNSALAEKFRYYTDNTAPDVVLSDLPYDFKNTDDICYLKNNIYLFPTSKFTTGLIFNLERALKQFILAIESDNKHVFAFNKKDVISYTNIIMQKVNAIKSSAKSQQEICDQMRELNKYMAIHTPPEGFRMAKFILSSETPALLDDVDISIVEKVSLSPGDLNALKARKAIMGVLSTYDINTIKGLNEGFKIAIPTSSSEVDNII